MYLLHAIMPIKDFDKNLVWLELWLPKIQDKRLHVSFVLDDPSDSEWERAKHYLEEKCNFDYLIERISARSPGVARNHALGKIESKWICFWDADDRPEVAKLVQRLEISTAEIVVFRFKVEDMRIIHDTSVRSWVKSPNWNLNIVSRFPGFWRMAFQSKLLENIKFTPLLMGEDLDFLFQVNLPKKKIEFNNTTVYTYRRFAPSSLSKDARALNDLPELVTQLEFRLKNPIMQNSFNYSIYFRALVSANRYSDKGIFYVAHKVGAMLVSQPFKAIAGLIRVFLVVPFRMGTR